MLLSLSFSFVPFLSFVLSLSLFSSPSFSFSPSLFLHRHARARVTRVSEFISARQPSARVWTLGTFTDWSTSVANPEFRVRSKANPRYVVSVIVRHVLSRSTIFCQKSWNVQATVRGRETEEVADIGRRFLSSCLYEYTLKVNSCKRW